MKKLFFLLIASLLSTVIVFSQTLVVPSDNTGTAGESAFSGPHSAQNRTIQWLINSSLLTEMTGKPITGISFRSKSSVAWPTAATTQTSFDIYLAPGVAPASRGLLNDNITAARTLVRSGSLTIPAAAYPATSPSSWGPVITFDQPYVYTGGHLVLEIRYTPASSSLSCDARATGASGYGTLFSAGYINAYAPSSGTLTQGNFLLPRFSYNSLLPITLTTFDGSISGNNALLNWSASATVANEYFEVERSTDGQRFVKIGSIPAVPGGDQHAYDFTDAGAVAHGATLYYRLGLGEHERNMRYSNTITLRVPRNVESRIVLSPNPAADQLKLQIPSSSESTAVYRIIDLSGRILQQGNLSLLRGAATTAQLDISHLPSGTYILDVKNETLQQQLRFVKK
jgi:hypothetical protein